jgi:hypothetical protein
LKAASERVPDTQRLPRHGDEEPREPYEWDAVEIGLMVGHVTQLNSIRGRKKIKYPVGFAQSKSRRKQVSAGRTSGSFPKVPRFDLGG